MPTHTRDEAYYAEQLSYWQPRSLHMLCTNNVSEVGFEITIPSTTMSDEANIEAAQRRIQNLLRFGVPVGSRARLSVEISPLEGNQARRYANELKISNPAAQMVTDATVRLLESGKRTEALNEYRAYFTCTMPLGRTFFQKNRAFGPEEIRKIDDRAWELRQRLQTALETAGFKPIPFSPQDHFRIPYRYFNPQLRGGVVPTYTPPEYHLPQKVLKKHPELASPSVRSQLLTSNYVPYPDYAFTAGHYLKIVSMGYQPVDFTMTGAVGKLLNTKRKFWLIMDFEHHSPAKFLRALQGRARRLRAMTGDAGGLSDYADPAKETEENETRGLISFLTQSSQHMFKVGMSMVLFDRTLEGVREGAKEAVAYFSEVPGVTPVEESSNLRNQFIDLAPLSGKNNDFMFLLTQENAADFYLMNFPWAGSSRAISLFWNTYDALTAIDTYDPKGANYNGVIIGGSGTGKTYFTQSLLSQLMRDGTQAILVDLKYDYAQLVEYYGGDTVSLGPDGKVCLNPFDLLPGEVEPDAAKKAFLLTFMRAILPREDSSDVSSENNILDAAIEQTYTRHTYETRNGNGDIVREFHGAVLSDFVQVLNTLDDIQGQAATPDDKKLARKLAAKFGSFVGNGQYAKLFNGPTNVNLEAQIIYFNVQGMADDVRLLPVALTVIADYTYTRIRQEPSIKKFVGFDEAWALLQIPEAAAAMQKFTRLARSYGGGIYFITQSMQDLLTEGARSILQNCTYHFLLPTPGQEDLVADVLKLPDNARHTFQKLVPKEEILVFIRTEEGTVGDVIRNIQPSILYWAFTSHPVERAERERTRAIYNGSLYPTLLDLARRYPLGMFRTPIKSEELEGDYREAA